MHTMRLILVAITLTCLNLVFVPVPALAQQPALRLLGEFVYPPRAMVQGTTVGELSGLTYDARRNVYYAVADDRGEFGAPRFYTLQIDISPSGIRDVRIVDVTFVDSDAGAPGIQPHAANDADLEEVVLLPNNQLIISSERDRNNVPWLRRFSLDGVLLGELPIPEKFLPQTERDAAGQTVQVRGVRRNLGFEGVALTPDGNTLYAVNEGALAQDGSIATFDAGSQVRIVRYGLRAGTAVPGAEFVYRTEPIFARPEPPTGAADNGVSAMMWVRHVLPQFDLLVMERSFVMGAGNDVNVYGVTLAGAQDVSGLESLPSPFTGRTVSKTLLANVRRAGANPDNLEAMTLGPRLPNGRPTLIVMSDDNFNETQRNQFLLFELGGAPGLPATGAATTDGAATPPHTIWIVAGIGTAGVLGALVLAPARRRLSLTCPEIE